MNLRLRSVYIYTPLTAVTQVLQEHNFKYKLQAKDYSDRVNHHRVSETKEEDTVLLKNLRPRKHEPVFNTELHTITRRTGNQVQVERDRDKKKYIRLLNLVEVVKRVDCKTFRDNVLNFKPGHDLVPSVVAAETKCEQPKSCENPISECVPENIPENILVYKIPYRRAPRLAYRASTVQPLGRVHRASKGILHTKNIPEPVKET